MADSHSNFELLLQISFHAVLPAPTFRATMALKSA
jgi:hypothetical protein